MSAVERRRDAPMFDTPARLYLIAPPDLEPARLRSALDAGDVACVLVTVTGDDAALIRTVGTIQAAGAAALLLDDVAAVERTGADGAHVEGPALQAAIRRLKPDRIVGTGGLPTRHECMEAGEAGIDYLMFGDPRPGPAPQPADDWLEQLEWWADIVEIPCVGVARSIADASLLVAAGADFVALCDAVWIHPNGAASAVREAVAAVEAGAARRRSAASMDA